MENKLIIRHRNQKQIFEIFEDEIIADLNTSSHKLKYNIPLEEIKKTHFISKKKNNGFSFLAYFSFILNTLLIVYIFRDFLELSTVLIQSIALSTSLVAAFVFKIFYEQYDEKHIDASKILYFIYTKKNKTEVDRFIELIYKKQKEYFKKKYFKIDPIIPYHVQYERFIWLYSNEYINENEFEVIKEDLDRYSNFNSNFNL